MSRFHHNETYPPASYAKEPHDEIASLCSFSLKKLLFPVGVGESTLARFTTVQEASFLFSSSLHASLTEATGGAEGA